MSRPCVLTIAGSDSSGGAGIQADLRTIIAHQCYGACAITAVTAQNTLGVFHVHDVPVETLIQQIDCVLQDLPVSVIKIGMLANEKNIRAIARALAAVPHIPVVLDPVFSSKNDVSLLQSSAIGALITHLAPKTEVLTPNIPEAALLLGWPIQSRADVEKAGQALLQLGPRAVVIKGGHSSDPECADYLCFRDPLDKPAGIQGLWISRPRLNSPNTHGTGCTFATSFACGLAQQKSLEEAFQQAKEYTYQAIIRGQHEHLGRGCGPVL